MSKYHKINSVFNRDPKNKFRTLIEGEFSEDIFDELKNEQWIATEKVDGTNMRIEYSRENTRAFVLGRDDNSDLKPHLLYHIMDIATIGNINSTFGDICNNSLTIYGEGYGYKPFPKNHPYPVEIGFCVFDIKVGNRFLNKNLVDFYAHQLGFKTAPVVKRGTLLEIIEFAKNGFKSTWGDFIAEGVVCVPEKGWLKNNGERIITKIKYADFEVNRA